MSTCRAPIRSRATAAVTDDQRERAPACAAREPRSEAGLRQNLRVGVQYLAAWLAGQGCVPLYNLMEDAATAEISRAQIWQWQHHRALVEGQPLTAGRVRETFAARAARAASRR